MNIGPQPHVIGQIPAHVVRVVIDDDIIRIPEPVAAIADIVGSHAEVEPAKPETVGSSSRKVPDMPRTEPASEVSVLPRMIEVVVRITPSCVMAHPPVARVNVRNVRVTRRVAKVSVLLNGMRIAANGSRTAGWRRVPLPASALRQAWK